MRSMRGQSRAARAALHSAPTAAAKDGGWKRHRARAAATRAHPPLSGGRGVGRRGRSRAASERGSASRHDAQPRVKGGMRVSALFEKTRVRAFVLDFMGEGG